MEAVLWLIKRVYFFDSLVINSGTRFMRRTLKSLHLLESAYLVTDCYRKQSSLVINFRKVHLFVSCKYKYMYTLLIH